MEIEDDTPVPEASENVNQVSATRGSSNPTNLRPTRSPIEIHSRATNYNNLLKYIRQKCGEGFKCRYKPQSFSIYIDEMEKYNKINAEMEKSKIKYHTLP